MAKLKAESKTVADRIRAGMREEGIKGTVTGTGYARGRDLLEVRVADEHFQAVNEIVGRLARPSSVGTSYRVPTMVIYVDGGR